MQENKSCSSYKSVQSNRFLFVSTNFITVISVPRIVTAIGTVLCWSNSTRWAIWTEVNKNVRLSITVKVATAVWRAPGQQVLYKVYLRMFSQCYGTIAGQVSDQIGSRLALWRSHQLWKFSCLWQQRQHHPQPTHQQYHIILIVDDILLKEVYPDIFTHHATT